MVYLPAARTLVSLESLQVLLGRCSVQRLALIASFRVLDLHIMFTLFFLLVIFGVVVEMSHEFAALRWNDDLSRISILIDTLRTYGALDLFPALGLV